MRLDVHERALKTFEKLQAVAGKIPPERAGEYARDMARLEKLLEDGALHNPGLTFRPWVRGAQFFDGQVWRDCHNPQQGAVWEAFQRALKGDGKRFIAVFGANQSGKSVIGARCMWEAMRQTENGQYWAGAPDFDHSRMNQQQRMWDLRMWSIAKRGQRHWSETDGFGAQRPQIVVKAPDWKRGTMLHFKSYMSGTLSWSSGTLNGIWMDEPPWEDILNECYARVSVRSGFILLTATFMDAGDPVYQKIMESPNWEKLFLSFESNPQQTDESKALLMGEFSEEERAARLEGRPVSRAGRVFPKWKMEPPFFQGIENAPSREDAHLVDAIDWHESRPVAYVLALVDSKGRIWTIEELEVDGSPVEVVRGIWEARLGRPVGDTEWEDVLDGGFALPKKWRSVQPGMTILDSHVKKRKDRIAEDLDVFFQQHGVNTVASQRLPLEDSYRLVADVLCGRYSTVHRRAYDASWEKPDPQVIITTQTSVLAQQVLRAEWDIRMTRTSVRRFGLRHEKMREVGNDLFDGLRYIVLQAPNRFISQDEQQEMKAQRRKLFRRVGATVGRKRAGAHVLR